MLCFPMLISSLPGANPLPPEHKIGIFVRFGGATAGATARSNGSNGSNGSNESNGNNGSNQSNGNNRSNRNDGRDSLGC